VVALDARGENLANEVESSEADEDRLAVSKDLAVDGRPEAKSGTFFSLRKDTTRELFQLAWPIAAAMLGETAIGLVDTKLVGGLGAAALAGVGVGTTFMFLGYAFVFGVLRGVKVCASHALGEGRPQDGFSYARAGMVIGFLLGTIELIACRDVSRVLVFIGTDPAVIPYARDFLAAVTLGAPMTCALSALIQHRQAISDSRTPMVVGILGNAFNALLGWSLIYGHFGLPALGVKGGGFATAATETIELTVMLWLFMRTERTSVRSSLSFGKAVREVFGLGGPTGVQYGIEMIAFATFTAVLSGISSQEMAAHQIALNVVRISFLPGFAVAEAASVLVGQALGRRRLDQADSAVKSGLGLATAFMAVWGVIFALAGGVIAAFFTNDAEALAITRRLLLVAAAFQVLDAVNMVLRCSLRGAKDVRAVAAIGIATVWVFIPTSAFLLGRLAGLGALGGWIGFVGETTFGAALCWLRWKRGGWRTAYAS
jgi:multidrug resistance protein, MATE family